MKHWVLATGNQGKVDEMVGILADLGVKVLPQRHFDVRDVAETGTTFVENAIIKARHAATETGLPALADDSGLEVDALDGEPGVYSARYASDQASDVENIEKLLQAMEGVPEADRSARYHCVLVLMRHAKDPMPLIFHGCWEGNILTEPKGDKGFGYDPIFWVPEYVCSSAQLDPEKKQMVSHRARALEALRLVLENDGKYLEC